MIYEKTEWESGVTPCSASNFNKMEKGIYDNSVFLNQLSNDNVLHNADFRNPVNQRGLSTYQGAADKYVFTIDRWFLSKTTVNYVRIQSDYASVCIASGGFIAQGIEDTNMLSDEMAVTIKVKNAEDVYVLTKKSGENFGTITYDGDSLDVLLENNFFKIVNNSSSAVTMNIEYIKLERGINATPFVPRTYACELMICKRYYEENEIILNPLLGTTPATYYVVVNGCNFECEMRVQPEVTFGTFYDNTNTAISDASVTSYAISSKYIRTVGFNRTIATWFIKASYKADAEIYP